MDTMQALALAQFHWKTAMDLMERVHRDLFAPAYSGYAPTHVYQMPAFQFIQIPQQQPLQPQLQQALQPQLQQPLEAPLQQPMEAPGTAPSLDVSAQGLNAEAASFHPAAEEYPPLSPAVQKKKRVQMRRFIKHKKVIKIKKISSA